MVSHIGEVTVEIAQGRAASENKPGTSPVYRNMAAKAELPTSFEGATTLYELFRRSAKTFPSCRCIGWRPVDAQGAAGPYQFHTFKRTQELSQHVASAFQQCGVKPGDRLGVYSANRVEWMLTARAADYLSATLVPIYDSLGESSVEYITNHSGLSLAVVEASKLTPFCQVLDKFSDHVHTLVYIGKAEEELLQKARAAGMKVYSFDEFVELGKGKAVEAHPPKPEDTICIMYTSGTTGAPKGVELTHRNLISSVSGANTVFKQGNFTLGPGDSTLGYLPMAHIFDRVIEELMMSLGVAIGYWQGNVKTLMEDIQALRPTVFIAVPRILQRVAAGVKAKVDKSFFIQKGLFNGAYALKSWRLKRGAPTWWAGVGVDQLVFNKIRKAMGGKVRFIVSGGAPLAPHDEDFTKVALGPVLQGYGLTETCAASFITLPNRVKMSYTVGPPMGSTEFRFESVPELKYDATATPPKGEICIRGPAVFKGYYKNPEKTAEDMDEDGFFHTGDIGTLTEEGCLKIIDRKKNIFKMAQGEYIAVEYVESVFARCTAVEQLWVYGNSMENFLVAVVVPKPEWIAEHAGGGDQAAAVKKDEVKKAMLDELTRVGKEGKLKGFEMVKAVYLETEPFSVENDLMTPSMKVKRPQLLEHYKAEVDAMYAALNKRSK